MTPLTQAELVRVFGRIGLLSFGGPAAQIALMHSELVDRHKWLSEQEFLRALSLCMVLPGPEAMQLATYAGWKLRGTTGGLIAGLLFVIPGAIVILALALGYAVWGGVPLVQAAFAGIKAAVIIIVLQALLKVARKAMTGPGAWGIAGAAFVALFVFGVPFPVIILAAGIWGVMTRDRDRDVAAVRPAHRPRTMHVIFVWGGLWLAPLLILALTGPAFLMQTGLFFSKLAVLTFGGAYAVLAWMTQTVVSDYGWISTDQMIDALGLAETTPGPLILVTQFVAHLAGFLQGGLWLALAAGALTLWVTFIPCFLWIFLAAPWLNVISAKPGVSAALGAITAAVTGVILNLAVWFAVHVLFREVSTLPGLAMPAPLLSSLDPVAVGLTAVAACLMLGLRQSIPRTLLFMAGAGIIAGLF